MTKQVLDDEGWLKTGDFGILRSNGSLIVLDRIDEIQIN
jgi:long-subunit acyl-CoA synthetase (AMP-forming)